MPTAFPPADKERSALDRPQRTEMPAIDGNS
jgi:hypothetical protein